MDSSFNPYSFSLLLSGVVTLLLSYLIFQGKGKPIKWFAGMVLFSAIWAIAYAFELMSGSLSQMLFWIRIEYVGISFLPAFWIVFMILFVGRKQWLTWASYFLIFAFPVVALVLVWTNSYHHLHYQSVSIDTSGPFPMLSIQPGPWYYVHTVYFYFLLALGLYILISRFRRADSVFRKQNRTILVGAFIPWTVNIIYLLGGRPYGHIDLTPYAFLLTSLVVGFGLLRFRLFDLLPLAREKIVEGMHEGILVLDNTGEVIDLNRAMKRFLFPYSLGVIGKPLHILFPDEVELRRLVKERVPGRIEIRTSGRRTESYFEVAITPLLEKQSYEGTLLIFWNITERKQTAGKLKDQATQLHDLNELKNRLFSIIAHDLRSPLASLVSILNILEQGIISDHEFKESFLPLLSRNVGSTSELLDNLLSWSRAQLTGAAIEAEAFDLHELLKSKFDLLEKRSQEKSIALNFSVEPGTTICADKSMMTLVIRNLLGNAIKFCNASDEIRVTADQLEHETIICVADTGIGMAEDTVNKLFGLGTLTTPGTQKEKGTGIGLRLCKDFVVMNGGKMWVESQLKKGSHFYFSLPRTIKDQETNSSSPGLVATP